MKTTKPLTKLLCPKCKYPINSKDSRTQSRTCFSCGYTTKGTLEIHKLITANSKEIAQDYIKLGLTDTLVKWGISTTSLYRIPEVRELKGKYRKFLHKKEYLEEKSLPNFPEFSNNWGESVQVKWLEIYETLIKRMNGNENS